VFNGCVYNHAELRTALEGRGRRFETHHSDTEALLQAYLDAGLACDRRLDAMFAMCVWDRRLGSLRALRDPAGEKPLWTLLDHADPGLGVFASVPGAITRLGGVLPRWRSTRPDPGSVGAWCRLGTNAASPTLDAALAEPGVWLETFSDGEVCLPLAERDDTGPRYKGLARTDARLDADRVEALLAAGVRTRLTADVPLGCFLSGGVDSALIAALARRELDELSTWTLRMPDPAYDESEAARQTAQHLGTTHHTLECETCAADDLVMLIERLGLPFGDSSLLPTYWLSRAAREHIKVALAGDGGDELFGGYDRQSIVPFAARYRGLLAALPTSLLDERDLTSRSARLARLVRAARRDGYVGLLSIFQSPQLRRLLVTRPPLPDPKLPFRLAPDPLTRDFLRYLPDDLLMKTDTASMAVGLEVRAPFLNPPLVEACLSAPLETLMPGGARKGLLKQVARRHLPDHIVDRPKRGFAIPIGEWFRTDFGGMRQLLHDHLESADPFPGLGEGGVEINMSFVRRMRREHDAAGEKSLNPWHGRDHSQRLYMLLVLSIWAKWFERVRREG
ncbi:MAG: asparagine synthase (glutamine-hydrolyzing), partial [Phycisphaerales bacterium]